MPSDQNRAWYELKKIKPMDSLPFSQQQPPPLGFRLLFLQDNATHALAKKTELDHTLLSEKQPQSRAHLHRNNGISRASFAAVAEVMYLRQVKHNRELCQQSEAEDRVEHANDEERWVLVEAPSSRPGEKM